MMLQQRKSVLVVEDERIVAKDIQQTLIELGYDAYAIASSAEDAVARASERCPDLVLMDIRIQGQLDGVETATLLKTRFDVPIVYLTAHADEATLGRATMTEPYGYLLKPANAAELRSAVEVSLHKHALERRLRERERWFSTTLHSIADAVIAIDLAGNVNFMNAAAESLTGSHASAAKGKPVRDVLQIVDPPTASDDSPILRALRERRSVELREGSLLNLASGTRRLINDSAAPVIDADSLLGAVMVFRDVTEQRKLEKQLELADRLASLGTMAASVAHEINNPLAVVVGNVEVIGELLKGLQTPDGISASELGNFEKRIETAIVGLADIQAAATRIGRIVSDLRSFSRRPEQPTDSVDVARCINYAIKATAHEFRGRARVVTDFADVPSVRADQTRLEQVIINLLVNAAHAIAPGNADGNQVCVETSKDHQGRAVVTVRDTGEGMPKEIIKRIFEPFFTTKTVDVGTGLGLSISQGIVNSIGGEILVSSEVDVGTTIQLLLPAYASELISTAIEPIESVGVRSGRILIVDDEEMILSVMKRALSDHEVCCVTSAQEAIALIGQGQEFDLVFSDLIMPLMSGMDFYAALLREKPALARQVVFLSGGVVTAGADDFLRSVPNLHIAKPFDVLELKGIVQRLLLLAV